MQRRWDRRSQAARAVLAAQVYEVALNESESFEVDNLGANVAYLMGAILKGEQFEACEGTHDSFVQLLHKHFSLDHEVWSSVTLMK